MCINYSVIVPVYNAEGTLIRCIESILTSAKKITGTLELILIDDGSTDNSLTICKDYACRDSRIIWIHQKNQGVSAARNAGIRIAHGEFILFADSDDCFLPDCLRIIEDRIRTHSVDYYLFSYIKRNGNRRKRIRMKECCIFGQKKELFSKISDLIVTKQINSPWAKVYRLDIMKNHHILFPPGVSIAEDKAFNLSYSMYISSIYISDQPVYEVYTDNENSLSRRKKEYLYEQSSQSDAYVKSQLKKSGLNEEEKSYYIRSFGFLKYRSVYSYAKRLIREGIPGMERYRRLMKKISKICYERPSIPITPYCICFVLPVWLRMVWLIDFGMKRTIRQ